MSIGLAIRYQHIFVSCFIRGPHGDLCVASIHCIGAIYPMMYQHHSVQQHKGHEILNIRRSNRQRLVLGPH